MIRRRPRRVLVADDDGDLRRVILARLAREGYGVEAASTGRETICRAVAGPPHVLLLDISFPDLDGHRVLEALRAWEGTAGITVAMLTGDRTPGAVIRAAERGGVEAYFAKPFEWSDVLERIESFPFHGRPPDGIPLAAGPRAWRVGPLPRVGRAEASRIVTLIRALSSRFRGEAFEIEFRGSQVQPAGAEVIEDAVGAGLPAVCAGLDEAEGEEGAVTTLRRAFFVPDPGPLSVEVRREDRSVGLLAVGGRPSADEIGHLERHLSSHLGRCRTLVLEIDGLSPDEEALREIARVCGATARPDEPRIHLVARRGETRVFLSPLLPHGTAVFADEGEALAALLPSSAAPAATSLR